MEAHWDEMTAMHQPWADTSEMPANLEGCICSVHTYEQRVWLWREGSMAPGFRPSLPLVAFE